ncbi:MAG: hypothetical protein MJA31_02520, partial [Clostridia bacterium]|nr:hypothetical protein [Clostridia bacterium]
SIVEMNGVANDDLYFNVSGYDLIVTDTATGEYLTLKNQFYYTNYGYEFASVNGMDITNGLTVKGTSATAAETLKGGNSADIILAQSGDDTAYGGDGNDTIYGGTGNDILIGDTGVDTFIHEVGDGNDILHGHTLNHTHTNDLSIVEMNGVANDDLYFNVSGRDLIVTDTINNESLTLKNQFYYTNYGYEFASVNGIDVTGGLLIRGTSATDGEALHGTVNADTIEGGLGADILTGYAGNDIFAFADVAESTTTETDIITDFAMGSDVIDLSAIASIDELSDITISQSGGSTFVDDNGSDFRIQITGSQSLTASDFAFV